MKHKLFLLIGVLCFFLFLKKISASDLKLLRLVEGNLIAFLIGMNGLVLLLKTWRWHILLSQLNITLPWRILFRSVSSGFYLGLVSPGTAGEFARILKVPVKPSLGLFTIALEKVTDLGVLVCFSIAGLVYWVYPEGGILLGAVIPLMILVVMVLSLGRMKKGTHPRIEWMFKRFKVKDMAWKEALPYFGRKGILCMSIGVSFLLWVIPGFQYYLICRAVHIDMSLQSLVISLYGPYLAGVLSMIPLGIGVFDIGASELLRSISGGQEAIGISLLLFRLLTTLPLVLFGLICFLQIILRREERKY